MKELYSSEGASRQTHLDVNKMPLRLGLSWFNWFIISANFKYYTLFFNFTFPYFLHSFYGNFINK